MFPLPEVKQACTSTFAFEMKESNRPRRENLPRACGEKYSLRNRKPLDVVQFEHLSQ